MTDELIEERVRLLGVLRLRLPDVKFPIRRRIIHPDDFRNMINPLRTRRDYTSVGRPVFLVDELPEGLENDND